MKKKYVAPEGFQEAIGWESLLTTASAHGNLGKFNKNEREHREVVSESDSEDGDALGDDMGY